jgi:hypothetical protein
MPVRTNFLKVGRAGFEIVEGTCVVDFAEYFVRQCDQGGVVVEFARFLLGDDAFALAHSPREFALILFSQWLLLAVSCMGYPDESCPQQLY